MSTYTPEFLMSLLPPIMSDLDTNGDLYDFLSIFVDILNEFEAKIEGFSTFYNPDIAPTVILDTLSQAMGLTFNKNFTELQLRSAIGGAVHWYRKKGTIASLKELTKSLGYTSYITEYKADPLDRPYTIEINAGSAANITGVVLNYPTGVYTTYPLVYSITDTTLTWGGGLPVNVMAGGVYSLTASDGNSTIQAVVTSGSLPSGTETDSVEIIADAPHYFVDASDYDLDTLMDDITGWLPISTNALVLTTVPAEVKVGISAIKFNKNTDLAYTGIARDFVGFVLKDTNLLRMRCEWWVYIPDMTNVIGVCVRLSNTSYVLDTDYSEWVYTKDHLGFPLQVGWNKILVNLLGAPIHTSGTFDIEGIIKSIAVTVQTKIPADILTGVILDGIRFYSQGIQTPLFDVLFTNNPGVAIDLNIVNFLKSEILANKPVYEILNNFTYLLGGSALIDYISTLTRSSNVYLDYFPTLMSDQELPPNILAPNIIYSDIGLMSDCNSLFCTLSISTV